MVEQNDGSHRFGGGRSHPVVYTDAVPIGKVVAAAEGVATRLGEEASNEVAAQKTAAEGEIKKRLIIGEIQLRTDPVLDAIIGFAKQLESKRVEKEPKIHKGRLRALYEKKVKEPTITKYNDGGTILQASGEETKFKMAYSTVEVGDKKDIIPHEYGQDYILYGNHPDFVQSGLPQHLVMFWQGEMRDVSRTIYLESDTLEGQDPVTLDVLKGIAEKGSFHVTWGGLNDDPTLTIYKTSYGPKDKSIDLTYVYNPHENQFEVEKEKWEKDKDVKPIPASIYFAMLEEQLAKVPKD